MANSERCTICGYQESDHCFNDSVTTCSDFKSEVVHLADCPTIGCNGDCETMILETEAAAVRSANRLRQTWFLRGPTIVMLDIGS